MHDAAMRRRLAALVIAALLAISGAVLATVVLATEDQTAVNSAGNTGNAQNLALRGGGDGDQ
jgi:ABC-type cobalamin transport system permease subunit